MVESAGQRQLVACRPMHALDHRCKVQREQCQQGEQLNMTQLPPNLRRHLSQPRPPPTRISLLPRHPRRKQISSQIAQSALNCLPSVILISPQICHPPDCLMIFSTHFKEYRIRERSTNPPLPPNCQVPKPNFPETASTYTQRKIISSANTQSSLRTDHSAPSSHPNHSNLSEIQQFFYSFSSQISRNLTLLNSTNPPTCQLTTPNSQGI